LLGTVDFALLLLPIRKMRVSGWAGQDYFSVVCAGSVPGSSIMLSGLQAACVVSCAIGSGVVFTSVLCSA
jgi:hypothetical protein